MYVCISLSLYIYIYIYYSRVRWVLRACTMVIIRSPRHIMQCRTPLSDVKLATPSFSEAKPEQLIRRHAKSTCHRHARRRTINSSGRCDPSAGKAAQLHPEMPLEVHWTIPVRIESTGKERIDKALEHTFKSLCTMPLASEIMLGNTAPSDACLKEASVNTIHHTITQYHTVEHIYIYIYIYSNAI